jgi:hypothetical protein
MGALSAEFRRKGLQEQKLKETSNSVFAKFGPVDSAVRFEATFRKVGEVVVRRFEIVDGSFAAVLTLSAESLLKEKILAYAARRKARDLYDVFFLVHVAERGTPADGELRRLLSSFSPPVDERSLGATIIIGSVPTVADMREEIGRWVR